MSSRAVEPAGGTQANKEPGEQAAKSRAANGKGTVVPRYRTLPDGTQRLIDYQGSVRYSPERLAVYGATRVIAEKKLEIVKSAVLIEAIAPTQSEVRRLQVLLKALFPGGVLRMRQADVRRLLERAKAERSTAGQAEATVGELLEAWLQSEISPPLRRESTHVRYAKNVQIMNTFIGATPVRLFGLPEVSKLQVDLDTAGRRPGVIRICMYNLRSALKFGEGEGWPVRANLTQRIRVPTTPPPKEHFAYSLEQLQQVLLTAYTHRLGAAFILGGSMGLRRGEMCGLRWQSIDWEQGILMVESQLIWHTHNHQPRLTEILKTASSHRRLYLTQIALAALKRRQAVQQEEQRLAGAAWQATDLVFTSMEGGLLTHTMIETAHETILRWSRIWQGTIHDLRRSCSTQIELAGTPSLVVERLLGHRRDPYRCAQAAEMAAAAHLMDRLLNFEIDDRGVRIGKPAALILW